MTDTAVAENRVKVGFFSFTEVLDDRHREYNEWHLFDHMPEQFKLEGLHWGQRWVATPELMGRRAFASSALAKTHYVTLYLITEPVQQALADFFALARALHNQGRFFEARRSHLSGPFSLVETYAAPTTPLDAAAIPYRPNRGIFVTVHRAARAAMAASTDEAHAPALLGVTGVIGCWSFEDTDGRTIRVYWLDEEPNLFLDRLEAHTPAMPTVDLGPAYEPLLVGAYQSIPWDSAFDWFD